MKNNNWRIFLSYRTCNSLSFNVMERLFEYLHRNPMHKKLYGNIYFAPETSQPGTNHMLDIPDIMKNVKFFVIPLTKDYFNDFWDQKNNRPNKESITYCEINNAIKVNCRFICINFPDSNTDSNLYKKLFNDNAEIIGCVQQEPYVAEQEEELFRKIGDAMLATDYEPFNMKQMLRKAPAMKKNIALGFKSDTENSNYFPFFERLYGLRKLSLLNFAASSFISGIDIATIYKESDDLKRYFQYSITKGDTEAEIIINDPHSFAAQDAADYKMNPSGSKLPPNQIILHNLNTLYAFLKKNPQIKIQVYLTDIALPYGIMKADFRNTDKNYIKIDLYSPLPQEDSRRPSFYILQSDAASLPMYRFFEGNLDSVKNIAQRFTVKQAVPWLLRKHIIHKGMFDSSCLPHRKKSFEKCVEQSYPMEVDLLFLKSGEVIVGRDDEDVSEYTGGKKLSELTLSEFKKLNRKISDNKILTLEEFLELIGGRISLLLEIKTQEKEPTEQMYKYVEKTVSAVIKYIKENYGKLRTGKNGIAIHSANPYVLAAVKAIDCMIPCGIISTDFGRIRQEVGDKFYTMHKQCDFFNIVCPDFISYDIRYLGNGSAAKMREDHNIPILGWTVRNSNDQLDADDYGCNNIIIEGAADYS